MLAQHGVWWGEEELDLLCDGVVLHAGLLFAGKTLQRGKHFEVKILRQLGATKGFEQRVKIFVGCAMAHIKKIGPGFQRRWGGVDKERAVDAEWDGMNSGWVEVGVEVLQILGRMIADRQQCSCSLETAAFLGDKGVIGGGSPFVQHVVDWVDVGCACVDIAIIGMEDDSGVQGSGCQRGNFVLQSKAPAALEAQRREMAGLSVGPAFG